MLDYAAIARAEQLESIRSQPRSSRVFDHLDAVPLSSPTELEERTLTSVARRMRSSEWWRMVSEYVAPEAVSGEIES